MDIRAYIQSGIIESYVLGIASDEEVAEIEQLMKQHPEIRLAVDEFSESLELHAFDNTVKPPAFVKEALLQTLAGEFQAPVDKPLTVAATTATPEKLTPPSSFTVWRFAAAASIILLLTSAAFNIYLYNRYSSTSQAYHKLLSETTQLQAQNDVYKASMLDTSTYIIKMPGVPGREQLAAVVLWTPGQEKVIVIGDELPKPAKGKQYQLWALLDGKPIDAGVMDKNCTGACIMKKINAAQAFAITLEKEGGSPTPDLTQLVVMGKV